MLFFVVLAMSYSASVPIFENSDEAEHFIFIHTLLESGELPVIQSREAMARQEDPVQRWNNQSHHAPLYYLLGSALVSTTGREDIRQYLIPNELIFLRDTTENNANKWLHRYQEPTSDTHQAVVTLRAANIAVGMATLLLVFGCAWQVSQKASIALTATALTASLPTFIVVNSSVTNDALLIFFYTAGVLWALHTWQSAVLTWTKAILLSLILAGTALTKLTGLSLFGVVFAALALGAWRGKWRWRQATLVFSLGVVVTGLLAGWWYLRNFQLYGDPLAVAATQTIWGRGGGVLLGEELLRIGKSFWMMVGYLHAPVFAPDGFYLYLAAITAVGLVGAIGWGWRGKSNRAVFALLIWVCVVVIGMLLYGTRSVDISYGRLLLPAIGAFVPLLALGWWTIVRRFAPLLLIPLALLALLGPVRIIPQAYPALALDPAVPESAMPIGWQAESLELVALDVAQAQVKAGDTLHLDLYFRGSHPTNPALIVTAADSLYIERLGHVEVYPGMAAVNLLDDDTLYRVPLRLPISAPNDDPQPRLVMILLEWVDLETNEALVFDSGESLLEMRGPLFTDTAYQPPALANEADVHFGDAIRLHSYDLQRGEDGKLALRFAWEALRNLDEDWTLTLQFFDADGVLLAQEDGQPYWNPTSRWIPELRFLDVRSVPLPPDAAEVRVGWYRETTDGFIRLALPEGADNLLVIPLADEG